MSIDSTSEWYCSDKVEFLAELVVLGKVRSAHGVSSSSISFLEMLAACLASSFDVHVVIASLQLLAANASRITALAARCPSSVRSAPVTPSAFRAIKCRFWNTSKLDAFPRRRDDSAVGRMGRLLLRLRCHLTSSKRPRDGDAATSPLLATAVQRECDSTTSLHKSLVSEHFLFKTPCDVASTKIACAEGIAAMPEELQISAGMPVVVSHSGRHARNCDCAIIRAPVGRQALSFRHEGRDTDNVAQVKPVVLQMLQTSQAQANAESQLGDVAQFTMRMLFAAIKTSGN